MEISTFFIQYLRFLGFDTRDRNDYDKAELAQISADLSRAEKGFADSGLRVAKAESGDLWL